MDDWGDPWQDDVVPKRPPAIDTHILGDRASKERQVTPIISGFFENEAKWDEPDSSDVWATAHEEPVPPLSPQVVADAPGWDLPAPEPKDADKPHVTNEKDATTTHEDDALPPAEEASSDMGPESPFHEATSPPDAQEESGAPPATPTAPEVDSSDSGTTIGPEGAGFTALDTTSRPQSQDFESGISTRPSTSPSDVSHGDLLSDSTRTSFDDDTEVQKSNANGCADREKEEPEVVEDTESTDEREEQTPTPASVDDAPEDRPEDTPEDISDATPEHHAETATGERPEEAPEQTPELASELTTEPATEPSTEPTIEDTHENTLDDDDDDFDDFGDFEEEAEDVDLEEEGASNVESPAAEASSPPSGYVTPNLSEASPNSPRPFVKADFEPDLSLIGKLFSAVESKELPEVEDSPIKPTEARKAWYRLTRIETLREVESGRDHDNYVRVGWQGSTVRTEVNQIVGRWTSEDRINGRTLLGGKPGAMFGWDYPVPSPASSVFTINSHKRNASAATTPTKATFNLEETKQRPVSLAGPSPRKPSMTAAIDIPTFSWSFEGDESQEPAASSAPPSKTSFGSTNDSDNPWASPFADKASVPVSVPVSAPASKTSFEEMQDHDTAKNSFDGADDWGPAQASLPESHSWRQADTSVEKAESLNSVKSSFEETDTWQPVKTSLEQISDWKPEKISLEKPVDPRPQHTRTVSDSGIPITSPFDNPFAPEEPARTTAEIAADDTEQKAPEEKKKKKRLSWLSFGKKKKNNDSAHKRSVSNASFLSISGGPSVPSKTATLPSWESPWGRTAPKSPLINEVRRPEPEPEIARIEHEPEIPLRKAEPNPWDNAWDNAWDDARPPTAKSNVSHHKSDSLTKTSTPVDTIQKPPSPKEKLAPAPKLPSIETSPHLPETNASIDEDRSWGGVTESPMASPTIMSADENPWGEPWKATSTKAPIILSVEPPSASKPATKLAPLDTSVQSHEMDDDDEWGEMVESPAASSPVIVPPPTGGWQLPRSISPVNLPMGKPRVHPPSPLVPEPIRSATMPWSPASPTPAAANPPKPTSSWLPKLTSGRTSPALANPPRPISALNPTRSSTLPASPSTSSLPSWPQQPQKETQPPTAAAAAPPTSPPPAAAAPPSSSDPWASVDFSIFDKPAAPRRPPITTRFSSHTRTSSSPTFMTPQSSTSSFPSSTTTTSAAAPPVITFDKILGGATRTDRSSSSPLTFDQILQPRRGSARTFDDILAPAGAGAVEKGEGGEEGRSRSRSPGWAERDGEAVRRFVGGLVDLGYMLR